jgi:ferredoxin
VIAGKNGMQAKILRQDRLLALVDALIRDYVVVAPKDATCYGRIDAASEAYLSEGKPAKSPKEFFFPQRELLLSYELSAGDLALSEPEASSGSGRVLFGARPCDVAALPILDKVFGWDDVDPFYVRRRQETSIVSISCQEPCKTCFCTSLGGSPAGTEGTDLLMTPLGDSYHVQIVTDKGTKLAEQYTVLLEESDQRRNRERAAREDEWQAKIEKRVDISGLDQALSFDSPVWDKLTQECVDCGICTFLCPTCHCFDIQDEGNSNRGERIRLWDTCAFYEYTKTHAGQPRPTHNRRYRQRIMHKFQYYPKNFRQILCVGCGRCIQYCPVNIDLRKVLEVAKG